MTCIEKSSGHDLKTFECNGYALHTAEEKANTKSNCGILSHFNGGKREDDRFVFEEKAVLESSSLAAENGCIGNGAKDGDECFKIPDLDSPVKDDEDGYGVISGADKHIMLDCYKESNHNAIKDICIDMGVPQVDKILVENDSVGLYVSPLGADEKDEFGGDVLKKTLSGEIAQMQEVNIGTGANASTAKDDIKSVVVSSLEDRNVKESGEDTFSTKLFGSKSSPTGKVANDVPEKQPIGNEQLLPELHCQSCEEGITSGENISEKAHDSETIPKHEEEGMPDKTPAVLELQDLQKSSEDKASIGGQDQFADGEASFSSVGPMSGLITYSELNLHPGNISVRSDSSTTSTRSFAFPVLQSEWNSSPVRMSKAERRYGKQRGWMQGLLCCRF